MIFFSFFFVFQDYFVSLQKLFEDMRIITSEELRKIQLDLLQKTADFCESNGLRYFLCGGTLIGAVRHKGYIPWDDDIDVCMSRPDYNKLLEVTGGKISDDCRIIDPATDKAYKGVVPVAVYENSYLESKQFKGEENLKISISIFVYDGAPKSKIMQKYYYAKLYFLRAEHALCRANFKYVNTRPAQILGPVISKLYREKDVYKYKNKILKWQQKYSYEDSELVSTNMDSYSSREVFPKHTFEDSAELEFEGIKSHAFSNYREQLTRYYGDYMQLPPEEQRVPKHKFVAEIDDNFDFDAVL